MKATAIPLILYGMLLISPAAGNAEIFKYRDENDRLTFVDDISKVPAQFREQATRMREASAPPQAKSPAGKAADSFEAIETQPPEVIGEETKNTGYQTIVRIQGNRVLVPVKVALGNRVAKLHLLLDTGASTTVFHRQALASFDLPSGKLYQAKVAGGGTVPSEKIRFQRIEIGPFRQNMSFAMVIDHKGQDLPFDGMLGMDFLRDHPYSIDFSKGILTWQLSD